MAVKIKINNVTETIETCEKLIFYYIDAYEIRGANVGMMCEDLRRSFRNLKNIALLETKGE